MLRAIPPVFCHLKTFSDGKVQRGMILYTRHEGDKVKLTAHPAPIADISGQYALPLQEEAELVPPTPFEATLVSCGSEVRTRIWYTNIQVYLRPSKAWIPILEFEDSPRLPALHVFPLEGDTPATCAERIRELEQLRTSVLYPVMRTPSPGMRTDPLYYYPSVILEQLEPDLLSFTEELPAAVAAPAHPQPSPSPPGFVPRFVAEAVKKDAIAKETGCAITMSSIGECERVLMTNCFHLFDGAALESWMARKNECPSCRQPITDTMQV